MKYRLLIAIAFLLLLTSCVVTSVCYDDSDCGDGQSCERATGRCLSKCTADSSCPGVGQVCDPISGRCVNACRSSADCLSGRTCNVATGRCFVGECGDDTDCKAKNFTCVSHVCRPKKGAPLACPAGMVSIEDAYCIDRYEASRPDATATDAGVDGSKATSRAGVMPWQVKNNAEAQAACEAAGKDLCRELEWFHACRGAALLTYSYGDTYNPTTCNGIDKYCDCKGTCADRPACPFPYCYHQCGADFHPDPTATSSGCTNAYGVFDINGNVWEHIKGGDKMHIRGGAYNCGDSRKLHRCAYIPGTWAPSAQGFRCCWRQEKQP